MAFYDDKSPGDIIQSQDWDDFVDFAELISSNAYGHSSNAALHFTESSIDHTNISNIGSYTHSQIDSKLDDLYNFSSNTSLTKTGYASVSNGDSIAHGLPGKPTYASITPSGFSINFGATCSVDSNNINVYLTTAGTRNVFWTASM